MSYSHATPMTRARLYVLIDAFERDIRSILARYVTTDLGEPDTLKHLYEKASERRSDDEAATEETALSEYLDLREAYDLLNVHRALLPAELGQEVRECTATLDRLVAIRKRVMHPRPLLEGDSDATASILNLFRTRYWSETHRTIAQLDQDPTWEPLISLKESDSPTLHSLPLPEYDETGLVGRSKEVSEVYALIKRGRESVITITGEGGIGKTALALEVAYKLVDDIEQPFDAVLWTSLKHERLTAAGVREIAGAISDLTGSVQPLGRTLDRDFQGNLNDLRDALEGLKALIVFDNLETIGGLDFSQLYETLPDSISYLVTSRIGVGEYERRYALSPLSERDGLRLFNDFVNTRRVGALSRLSTETRIKVVSKLRHSPLAIRWFVLAVEAGRDPLSLLRDQTELLEFCVRSVYDSLSNAAQEVLAALSVLARPVTADELVVLLEKSADEINTGLQELIRGSLIRRDSTGTPGDLQFRVRLTETATHFLAKLVVVDQTLSKMISAREASYRRNEERRLEDTANRSLAPIVVRTTGPSDIPTAQLLRRALLASKAKNFTKAFADIETAHRLNSELYEVDRVEGFIRASSGDHGGASKAYESAYQKADREGKAVVAHFYAGHLARNVHDLPLAIQYAREAHDVMASKETAVALGGYYVWNREFQEGISLLEGAYPALEGRARLIALSSLASAYRRWAEYGRSEEHNPVLQYRRALRGLDISLASLEAGVADTKLRDAAADCASTALAGAVGALSDGLALPDLPALLQRVDSAIVRFTGTPSWARMCSVTGHLSRIAGAPKGTAALYERMTEIDSGQLEARGRASETLIGEIVSLKDGYGFIRHPAFPANLFFHRGDLSDGVAFDDLNSGALVSFSAVEGEKGPRAVEVSRRS